MEQNTAITREQVLRKRSEMLVIALVGKDLSDKWWDSQNKAFELKTPNEKWKENYETVYIMKQLREFLKSHNILGTVSYTEQGMQGDDYVSNEFNKTLSRLTRKH